MANHSLFSPVIVKRARHKAKQPNLPYVVKIHGSSLNFVVDKDPRWKYYVLEGLISANKIICSTQYMVDRLHKVVPESLPSIDTIAYGVNTNLFSKHPRKNYGINNKPFKIVFFSHILNIKGIAELIMTMPYLKEKHSDLEFHIVGDGTYETNMRHMLQGMYTNNINKFKNGAMEKKDSKKESFVSSHIDLDKYFKNCKDGFITYYGFMEHCKLSKLLSSCDLTVVPSKAPEAFGIVIIEAMASGVYPICADHSGLSNVVDLIGKYNEEITRYMRIKQGKYGIDMDHMIKSIDKAINYVKKTEGLANKLISISKNFNWRVICSKIMDSV